FLLFFWFGISHFHIGIRGYEEKNDKIIFIDKETNNLPEKMKWRDWNTYTIDYGDFLNNYNPNLQECIESETCQIKKDIDKIINFFKEQ
ncbi:hypothetical protein, partial [Nautilia sp.]